MVKIFGTAGMALAFYRTAKAENKQRLKVTLIPLIVTSVLVGITEPFEFLFIFTAPLLWLIYSLLDGFPDAGWLLHVRVCATNGLIDFVVYNLPAGVSATRWPVFVALGLLETATMYWSAPSVLPVCGCSPRAAKPQPKMSIRNRLIASIRIKARW